MKGNKKQKKQNRKGLKIFLIIFCLLFIGALATSLTFNVLLYRKANTPIIPENVEPISSDNVVIAPVEQEPRALLSMEMAKATTAADNTVTSLVTVTPNVDVAVQIDWAIAFANASSEWATGKTVTDYVTVTPTEDGALTANVTLLQAFGEQILVTASVRGDSDVNAQCTVDYVIKYSISSSSSYADKVTVKELTSGQNFNGTELTLNLQKSIGTIDEELTYEFSFCANPAFANLLDELFGSIESGPFTKKTELANMSVTSSQPVLTVNDLFRFSFVDKGIKPYGTVGTDSYYQRAYRMLGYAYQSDQTWAQYVEALSAISKTDMNTMNGLYNSVIGNHTVDMTAYEGVVSLEDAFTLKIRATGEHNRIATNLSLRLLLPETLPLAATELTIDTPSIIF